MNTTTTSLPTAIVAGRRESSLWILISVLIGGWALIDLAHHYHRPPPRRAAAPAAAVMSAGSDR